MKIARLAGWPKMTLVAACMAPLMASADDMPQPPDMELLTLHESCSATAAERGMVAGEAQLCAANYLLLKLSFLPDIDLDDFHALGFAERHAVQQEGYAAYLAWQNLQSDRADLDGNGM